MAANIDGSEIAYIAVGVLLGIAIIAAFIAQIVIVIGYWRGNRTNNSLGLSGGEYARKLLDQNGMPDVQVKKCGIIRTILFGNHYSITKRTVYLRMRTINKPVTRQYIANQLKQDRESEQLSMFDTHDPFTGSK